MKPKIKFKRTLCGTYYTICRGVIILVEKTDKGRWYAHCRIRDNYRFVKEDRLEGHTVHGKTRQEAARWVCAGLNCMASIDAKFAAFIGRCEAEEEFHQELQEINKEGR